MSDGMGREFTYLSSHATNRYFIPNWDIFMHRIRRLNLFPDHQICRASFSHIVGSKNSISVFLP